MTYTRPRHARSADEPVRADASPSPIPDDARALYSQRVDEATRELYFERVDDNTKRVGHNTRRIEKLETLVEARLSQPDADAILVEYKQRMAELEREVDRIRAIADSLHNGMFSGGCGGGGRPILRVIRGGGQGPTVVAFDGQALRECIERRFTRLTKVAQVRPALTYSVIGLAVVCSLLFAKLALLTEPVATSSAGAVALQQQHQQRRRAVVPVVGYSHVQTSSMSSAIVLYQDDDPPLLRVRGRDNDTLPPIAMLMMPRPNPSPTPSASASPSVSPSPSDSASPAPSTSATNGSTPGPSPS